METVRKSITFTEKQNEWIRLQIEKGDFTNDSEYIRDLVRKDQSENFKLLELKNAIDIGFNSGVSTKKISDLMREVDNGQL
ncbi:type II toxin-antitoxin system ParD family antitoxin [Polaribacter aestuariivivens]|uniref:Type II toxin-antitoxin system ParD family antitoxin n=1 Tax=Polaribacter aestuariivivens TaxID=2304626 RepID=A0A5S3NB67_9FLAO|nr:type II toxin-antitoxin system ParD family antitoxin [Polaribacter aestuariivivens]TMM32453.1 type II toxin-antitoxin system ParD family antitoxin [Polaribacter aestuariivivens]